MSELMSSSIVEYYAEHEGFKCGYCKSPDTNYSNGMWAHAMTPADYQELIDRGWRRSGKYCYKPTMDVTCCPMYTIRCRAQEFRASKSQKKNLKRFNKYLSSDEKEGLPRKMSCSSEGDAEANWEGREEFVESTREHQDINVNNVITDDSALVTDANDKDDKSNQPKATDVTMSATQQSVSEEAKSKEMNNSKKAVGPDPSKAPSKKAKQLRKERKLAKLKESGVDISTLDNSSKSKEKQLEDFLAELPDEVKNKLQIKLVRTCPPSAEYLGSARAALAVYGRYQAAVHGDAPDKCTQSHYNRFIVHSPLLETHSAGGPACGYGSFQQQYWLGARLAAVAVLDVLPKCVSSVYFFYDPQFASLTLGTYSALREIAFTRQLNKEAPDLKYYYMGYYIHSCPKMRYKGNYAASDLLCPETYNWVPIKEAIDKLEAAPYSRLDPDIDNLDDNCPSESVLNHIRVYLKGAILPYNLYKKKYKAGDSDKVMEYARLVGERTARNMILVI